MREASSWKDRSLKDQVEDLKRDRRNLAVLLDKAQAAIRNNIPGFDENGKVCFCVGQRGTGQPCKREMWCLTAKEAMDEFDEYVCKLCETHHVESRSCPIRPE
jgi:hypothetical protein